MGSAFRTGGVYAYSHAVTADEEFRERWVEQLRRYTGWSREDIVSSRYIAPFAVRLCRIESYEYTARCLCVRGQNTYVYSNHVYNYAHVAVCPVIAYPSTCFVRYTNIYAIRGSRKGVAEENPTHRHAANCSGPGGQ